MSEEQTVTPVEEEVQPVEETVEQTETTQEPEGEEPEVSVESSDVDYRQKYETLEREVEQLKGYIRTQEEDKEKGEEPITITKDVEEFLGEFAKNPQETLDKVIKANVRPYESMIRELQLQQANDYIRSQQDFSEKMYDDLTYVINGPDRTRYFNYNGQSVMLKDLPPRQKAEAALQILRGASQNKQKATATTTRPKPVTTTKSKPTHKLSDKPDEMLSAEEFAKKHGIRRGEL